MLYKEVFLFFGMLQILSEFTCQCCVDTQAYNNHFALRLRLPERLRIADVTASMQKNKHQGNTVTGGLRSIRAL